MKIYSTIILSLISTLLSVTRVSAAEPASSAEKSAEAQSGSKGQTVPVNVDNFVRAETDFYFSLKLKDDAFGKFLHHREPVAIDHQTVVRLNRDTLYSAAVFDLDAGPTTITLPDAGQRFMSMMIVNQDHYVPMVTYDPGPHLPLSFREIRSHALAPDKLLQNDLLVIQPANYSHL